MRDRYPLLMHGGRENHGKRLPVPPEQPSGGQRGGQRRQIGRGKWNGAAIKSKSQ